MFVPNSTPQIPSMWTWFRVDRLTFSIFMRFNFFTSNYTSVCRRWFDEIYFSECGNNQERGIFKISIPFFSRILSPSENFLIFFFFFFLYDHFHTNKEQKMKPGFVLLLVCHFVSKFYPYFTPSIFFFRFFSKFLMYKIFEVGIVWIQWLIGYYFAIDMICAFRYDIYARS